MPTSFDWNAVPVLRRDRIADAENYARQLNQGLSFHAWLHVGDGLIEWRDAALELAGTQNMDTPAYRSAWASAKPYYQHLTSIAEDKAVRSYTIWMAENREVLEAWYAGLGDKERRNWNHPRTIWNHSPLGKAAKAAQRASTEPRDRKTVTRDLHEAVERIAVAADQFERTTGGAAALTFDLSEEHYGESVGNFVAIYGAQYGDPAVARFARALLAVVEPAPAVLDGPVDDPAFTGSLKPVAGAQQEKLIQAVWACRAENPDWDHKQIAKKVRRAAAVVAQVLEDPDCARADEDDEALRCRFWALRQQRPELLPNGFARLLRCTRALAERMYSAASQFGEQAFLAGEWHLDDDEEP